MMAAFSRSGCEGSRAADGWQKVGGSRARSLQACGLCAGRASWDAGRLTLTLKQGCKSCDAGRRERGHKGTANEGFLVKRILDPARNISDYANEVTRYSFRPPDERRQIVAAVYHQLVVTTNEPPEVCIVQPGRIGVNASVKTPQYVVCSPRGHDIELVSGSTIPNARGSRQALPGGVRGGIHPWRWRRRWYSWTVRKRRLAVRHETRRQAPHPARGRPQGSRECGCRQTGGLGQLGQCINSTAQSTNERTRSWVLKMLRRRLSRATVFGR